MVQIYERPPSLGQQVGGALGSGISAGLQMLANQKMQGMQQAKQAQALAALGLDPGLAALSPELQKVYGQQQQQASQENLLSSILGGGPQPQGGQRQGGEEEVVAESVQEGPGLSDREVLAATAINPQLGRVLQSQQKEKQRTKEAERAFTQQEKQFAHKQAAPIRKEIHEESKAAHETTKILRRMDELSEKGDLPAPLAVGLLKKAGGFLGLDLTSLLSADAQEFEKLTVELTKTIKQAYGGRISNLELETFLKSVPSLSQSPEGRQRVAKSLQAFSQGKIARQKALQDILKKNDGVPPLDLMEQVDARAQDAVENSAEDFSEIISRVDVVTPDGRKATIPMSQLEAWNEKYGNK